jgi:anti-sigma-K factor RskA
MSIEEYISSGILESYVMGDLASKETIRVRSMISRYPEIQKEVQQIENALYALASADQKEAPSFVKTQLVDTIKKEQLSSDAKEVAIYTHWKLAAIVSGFIAITTAILLTYNTSRLSKAHLEIAKLNERQNQLTLRLDQTNTVLFDTETQLSMISSIDTRKIPLLDPGNQSKTIATIFWNTQDQNVYLGTNNLPLLNKDEQYQLWYLKDGQPFDAGLISSQTEFQEMKRVADAQAFAITIEPKGGSVSPTLDRLVVIGNVI